MLSSIDVYRAAVISHGTASGPLEEVLLTEPIRSHSNSSESTEANDSNRRECAEPSPTTRDRQRNLGKTEKSAFCLLTLRQHGGRGNQTASQSVVPWLGSP